MSFEPVHTWISSDVVVLRATLKLKCTCLPHIMLCNKSYSSYTVKKLLYQNCMQPKLTGIFMYILFGKLYFPHKQ